MRGDFHGDMALTTGHQSRQQALHGQRIGRGVRRGFSLTIHAGAQGTDDAAGRLSGHAQRLGDEVGAGGLAIGAGDADHAQAPRRLAIKAAGDQPEPLAQLRHGQQRQLLILHQRRAGPGRLPQHRQWRCGTHCVKKLQAMTLTTAQGQEQVAGPHAATIQAQAKHRPIDQAGRHLHQVRQQFTQGQRRRACAAHGVAPSGAAAVAPAIFMLGMSSGVMLRMRSAPLMVAENTGAATVPP